LATIVKTEGYVFVTGVPDSRIADDLREIDQMEGVRHIIAVDEGAAIGHAVGYHLATGKTGLVYMQPNGFCNALNPLVSLALPYEIPVRLVISYRTGLPQHQVMANRIYDLLRLFKIKALVV